MLDVVLGDVLIADAAKAANLSVDAYTERELARRLQPVTDADVQKFYDENKEPRRAGRWNSCANPSSSFSAASGSSRRGRSWSTISATRRATFA